MKLFLKYIIIVFFILFGASFCRAESATDVFFRANRQYDDGNFDEAVKLYERLISEGVVSGNIYYNLGNAYYKTGKKGKALLNYERADRLIPNNEDLFANMSFIRSALEVKQPEEAYPIYQKVWMGLRDSVSVNTWFVVSAVLFFAVCLIAGIGFLKYRFAGGLRMVLGILIFLLVMSLAFFIDGYNAGRRFKTGIIIVPETEARYSPSYSGAPAFKLFEAMKARIIRKQGSWTYVRLSREKSGWIESEAIEAV